MASESNRGWNLTPRAPRSPRKGTGKPFDFSGLEVFDFRGDRASRLVAHYDLIGLTKQIGIYAGARV